MMTVLIDYDGDAVHGGIQCLFKVDAGGYRIAQVVEPACLEGSCLTSIKLNDAGQLVLTLKTTDDLLAEMSDEPKEVLEKADA